MPVELDGVAGLHGDLLHRLAELGNASDRAAQFSDYMHVRFLLGHREDAGWTPGQRRDRSKADYRRLVRGWMFDPNGLEAAVLKGWVESRFGLIPRYHRAPIRSVSDKSYVAYQEDWAAGLYNSNALEAQLDLLYTYCQFELRCADDARTHVRLFRGVNRVGEHEILTGDGRGCGVLLNNLSSFTSSEERADEFGDCIMTADVPLTKIAFYSGLLPGLLQGEDEFAVIGGVYEVSLSHAVGTGVRV
jgi:NAD+--dinitrogen-reductase ADP-D-ribosyltransferase